MCFKIFDNPGRNLKIAVTVLDVGVHVSGNSPVDISASGGPILEIKKSYRHLHDYYINLGVLVVFIISVETSKLLSQ